MGISSSQPIMQPNREVSVVEATKIQPQNKSQGPEPMNEKKQNTTEKLLDGGNVAPSIVSATRATMLTTSAPATITAADVIPATYSYQPYAQYSLYPQGFAAALPVPSFGYQNIGAYSRVGIGAYSPVYSHFHTQDELGQYSYGYSGGPSSKVEVKTVDGVTRGGYSYIDANGILQKVNYVADPIGGFQVSGTNLPFSNMAPYFPTADYNLPDFNLIMEPDKAKHLD